VIVHELGHTFGLQHSANPVCVMTDYKGSMKGLDASSDSLCKGCRDAMDFLRIR
jgi:predicted Zn-dependent protease